MSDSNSTPIPSRWRTKRSSHDRVGVTFWSSGSRIFCVHGRHTPNPVVSEPPITKIVPCSSVLIARRRNSPQSKHLPGLLVMPKGGVDVKLYPLPFCGVNCSEISIIIKIPAENQPPRGSSLFVRSPFRDTLLQPFRMRPASRPYFDDDLSTARHLCRT